LIRRNEASPLPPELDELLVLVQEYEHLQRSLYSSRSALSALARTQSVERGAAERRAMFLEDCCRRCPASLLSSFRRFPDIPAADARAALEAAIRSHQSTDYRRLRQDIDDMMAEITAQQRLLSAEEAAISELRDSELRSRHQEDQLYETLMEQVHAVSGRYQFVRCENKAKRRQLRQLAGSNADLRKCVEHGREEVARAHEMLEAETDEGRRLAGRRRAAQDQMGTLGELEREAAGLTKENEDLVAEEAAWGERIAGLAAQLAAIREE
jgi:chromosome segregation ATPase